MLRFLEKRPDNRSLLCTGKLRVYSHVVTTPLRMLGVPLHRVKYLVEMFDEYRDVFKRFGVLAPILEIDLAVRRGGFPSLSKELERNSYYIDELRRRLSCYTFVVPFLSSEVSKRVIDEISSEGRSYRFSFFLSQLTVADYIDIFAIPIVKVQVYDRASRRMVQIVNAERYIKYVEHAIKYFEDRINKPFFVPFVRLPDEDLPRVLKYFIENGYTHILLDYDGASYKKLIDVVRLLQIEYDRAGMLRDLVLYGTRILRETVSKRSSEEVRFADILALMGVDILGSNYRKPIIVEGEEPVSRTRSGKEEEVERFFNNDTYGYRHERFLAEEERDLHELIQHLGLAKRGSRHYKKIVFSVINVHRHRKEAEKYIDIAARNEDVKAYLIMKRYVKREDVKLVKRSIANHEHTLDEYL